MTILIVEDNAGVRRLIRRAVAQIATEVWECADGADALPAYVQHRPDIVLMDIRMPVMDGLTAMRQVREHDPGARVMIVTDYADNAVRCAAHDAGACGYALKNDLPDLPNLIEQLATSKMVFEKRAHPSA